MAFCGWSPTPINALILDIFLKVTRDGFNTQMLTGFKLEILAGLSHTLVLCSTTRKNPLHKHYRHSALPVPLYKFHWNPVDMANQPVQE